MRSSCPDHGAVGLVRRLQAAGDTIRPAVVVAMVARVGGAGRVLAQARSHSESNSSCSSRRCCSRRRAARGCSRQGAGHAAGQRAGRATTVSCGAISQASQVDGSADVRRRPVRWQARVIHRQGGPARAGGVTSADPSQGLSGERTGASSDASAEGATRPETLRQKNGSDLMGSGERPAPWRGPPKG